MSKYLYQHAIYTEFLLFIIFTSSRKWNVSPSDPKYTYYMDFVKTVANVSYNALAEFKRFENDPTLQSINMVELVAKVGYFSLVPVTYINHHKICLDF